MITRALKGIFARNFIARNVRNRRHTKRALVSYIVHPFLPIPSPRHHTNVQEALALAEVLDNAGFIVDVVDYRIATVDFGYDLYIGFGNALERVAEQLRGEQTLVAYATGRASYYQANEAIRRGLAFESSYGFFPAQSIRLPSALWPLQIGMAHALVTLGDESTARTFDMYPTRPEQIRARIPATYSCSAEGRSIAQRRDWTVAKRNLLWFGGLGVVHKGLDLCIAAVDKFPNLTLHVCGVRTAEQYVVDECVRRSKSAHRVVLHGFVHPDTETFTKLASLCGFVALPSCSEGQATSVLTTVAGGGLIPLISDRCGLSDMPSPFHIGDLSANGVIDAIQKATDASENELNRIAMDCWSYATTEHSLDKYRQGMTRVFEDVLVRPRKSAIEA